MRVWFGLGFLVVVGCGGSTEFDAGVGLRDASAVDASHVDSGSAVDSGSVDSGSVDGGAAGDAGPITCNLEAVRFEGIARGPLVVGVLCDDFVVCVADAAEAARVMAASSAFQCAESHFACSGMTCIFRDPAGPSVIDEAELATICAVTNLSPTPDLACVVYGP